jgi:hypothetical protein
VLRSVGVERVIRVRESMGLAAKNKHITPKLYNSTTPKLLDSVTPELSIGGLGGLS